MPAARLSLPFIFPGISIFVRVSSLSRSPPLYFGSVFIIDLNLAGIGTFLFFSVCFGQLSINLGRQQADFATII